MFALKARLASRPTHEQWDLVSGLLYQFHSQGIEEGEEAPPEGEKALVAANEFEHALEPGLLSPPEEFIAYFKNRRDAERAQRAIEPVLLDLRPQYEIAEIEDKDYTEVWKQNFKPIASPPFWIIRAPWHESPKKKKKDLELIIEPGMAFGTGSHETTRACLELMAEAVQNAKPTPPRRVLDFGCGSGILAIALKKLGVEQVHGVDIDPLAIEATKQNAERNNVQVQADSGAAHYEELDGIVANILKNTLLEFGMSFERWLRKGGFLILSGLLAEQEDLILDHYKKLGFKLKKRISQNNWISLYLTK